MENTLNVKSVSRKGLNYMQKLIPVFVRNVIEIGELNVDIMMLLKVQSGRLN